MKRLHLGCGQVYLEGYTNIDFPLSEHTVQEKSVADKHADLTKMKYKADTIGEVRLHHVFEHFPRPQALALLASWHSWLKPGGVIHIEVPDFEATARKVLSPFTKDRDRKVGLRHIFGSNEAPWATHYEGWSKKRLAEAYESFGFTVSEARKSSYLATHNITMIGTKTKRTPAKTTFVKAARNYLYNFTVNDSEFEARLLEIWLDEFKRQLDNTFARP
jgi:predicted SAM-dependent methyltransferase